MKKNTNGTPLSSVVYMIAFAFVATSCSRAEVIHTPDPPKSTVDYVSDSISVSYIDSWATHALPDGTTREFPVRLGPETPVEPRALTGSNGTGTDHLRPLKLDLFFSEPALVQESFFQVGFRSVLLNPSESYHADILSIDLSEAEASGRIRMEIEAIPNVSRIKICAYNLKNLSGMIQSTACTVIFRLNGDVTQDQILSATGNSSVNDLLQYSGGSAYWWKSLPDEVPPMFDLSLDMDFGGGSWESIGSYDLQVLLESFADTLSMSVSDLSDPDLMQLQPWMPVAL